MLETLESRVMLTWIGATSGTTNDAAHDYNNTANWSGGVIDDSFNGVGFASGTTLYLSANRTTGSGGLNLNYAGGYSIILASSDPSTPRTFSIGGQSTTFETMDVIGPNETFEVDSPTQLGSAKVLLAGGTLHTVSDPSMANPLVILAGTTSYLRTENSKGSGVFENSKQTN